MIFYNAGNIVYDISGVSTKSADEKESAKPALLYADNMAKAVLEQKRRFREKILTGGSC